MELVWVIAGVVLGSAGMRLALRARLASARAEVAGLEGEVTRLEAEVARLGQDVETERRIAEERTRMAEEVRGSLGETIEAAASRAFQGNNQEFLTLAGQRLAPIDERLRSFEEQLRQLERTREGAYSSLTQQVRGLVEAQEVLRTETGKLASALSKPGVRGRWGEMTLRRIVELAGMHRHADFAEQPTLDGPEGRQRPDLVVHLPGGGDVAVDAKAPLDAYMAAAEATDPEVRERRLEEHARALREHLVSLGRKGYWEQFEASPEFVVMFVPGEAFVAAAVEQRPELFEEGLANKVILATPTTLMALLRVVAYGWNEERVAASARQVSELGRDLHKRIASMAGHWEMLGKRLDGAVDAYNRAVGSLERKVLPQARRFEDLGASSNADIAELDGLENRARSLSAPEMTDDDGRVVELSDRAEHPERAEHPDRADQPERRAAEG